MRVERREKTSWGAGIGPDFSLAFLVRRDWIRAAGPLTRGQRTVSDQPCIMDSVFFRSACLRCLVWVVVRPSLLPVINNSTH